MRAFCKVAPGVLAGMLVLGLAVGAASAAIVVGDL